MMTSPPPPAPTAADPTAVRRRAVLLCALAGAGVFQFFGNAGRGYIDSASLFHWWGFQWFNEGSETEHGPFVLALAAWLFWRNLRAAPTGATAEPEEEGPASYAALAGALVLHAFGYAVEQARISVAALLVFVWGLLRLAGGRRWGRAAVFPVGFLVFALPLNVLDSAGFYLRLRVIDAAHAWANLAGLEVIRNGTQLFSPDGSYQYDVAAACSGVRSLMALMALSVITAYLNLRSNLRRAAVFLLCLPLTYVGNVVRIAAIIFAGEWFGQAAGLWVHAWAGFVVFAVVLGGVFGAISLWQAWRPEAQQPRDVRQGVAKVRDPGANASPPAVIRRAWVRPVVIVVMAGATAAFTTWVDRWPVRGGAGVLLAEDGVNPVELPAFIGLDWVGQRAEVTPIEREVLPPDTGYARRNYVSTLNRQNQVFLSIVLSGRDRTSIHRPELCLVGQGWSLDSRFAHTFAHPSAGQVPATVLRISREVVDTRGGRRRVPALFAYWFVGRETIVSTHSGRLWQTAVNRLRGRTDRWAYVVVQTLALDSEPAALARLQMVLDGTLPAFLPAGE